MRYPNRSPLRILYNYDGDAERYLEHQKNFRKKIRGNQSYRSIDAIGESYLYSHLFKRTVIQVQLDEQIRIVNAAGPLASKNLDQLTNYTDHLRSEELEKAQATYKILSENFPDHLAAHFNYGRICFELNDNEKARVAFTHILDNPNLIYEPADLLMWSEFQDSKFDYEGLMFDLRNYELSGNDKYLASIKTAITESSLNYLGDILLQNGQNQTALDLFTQHLKVDARLLALYVTKFNLLLGAQEQKEAFRLISKIYRTHPWILATHGNEIVDGLRANELEHDEIYKAWNLFQERLS